MTPEQHIAELLAASQPHFVGVHPVVVSRTQDLIRAAVNESLYFGAFMGLRTWAQQDALYLQVPRVTKAKGGESWHNFGLAIDLVEDGDPEKAGVQWSWKNNLDYLKLGSLANEVKLEWGGFWKSFKDYPHVEITCGLTIVQAQQLYQAGGINGVWAEIDKRLGVAA